MARFLKTNTATLVTVGPFVDKTDGFTPEIAITATGQSMTFIVDNGATPSLIVDDVAMQSSGGANDILHITSDAAGYYTVELSAANVNYLGRATLNILDDSVHLPVFCEFNIISAHAWDEMFSTEDVHSRLVVMDAELTVISDQIASVLVDTGTQIPSNILIIDNLIDNEISDIHSRLVVMDAELTVISDAVGGIGASSGGALSFAASADNSGGTIDPGTTAFVGVETNNYTDTDAENGTRHQIADATNVIDVVYKFPVGGGRVASELVIKGFVNANNDDLSTRVWDHPGAAWEVLGTFTGQNGTVNITTNIPLLAKHTGTSATELGNVYVRFDGTSLSASADVNIDQILVEAVGIGQTAGYQGGQIWVDTGNGLAGTESFVNGTADNAVLTWADALTLSTNLGIKDFHIVNGSTIQLSATSSNFSLFGDNWTLQLNSQTCASSHFEGADASGTQTGTNCTFHGGEMGTCNIAADAAFDEVGLSGTFTLPAGAVEFFNCHHDSATAPIMDFGALVSNTTVHMHNYHGGVELYNFGDTGIDILHLDGQGKLTINSNSSGGTINLNGSWAVVNNASGVTINYDDNRSDLILLSSDAIIANSDIVLINAAVDAILVDTGTTLSAQITTIASDVVLIYSDTTSIALASGTIKKNVALSNFTFLMVDATDFATPETGKTITATRRLDDGSFAATSNAATEVGNGIYTIDLSAADMNGTIVTLRFTATGTADRFITIVTS